MTTEAAQQLAARLLCLQQQKKAVEKEERITRNALEELYNTNAIPAKDDMDMLFSDGTFHKVRLARVKTGTYFKVSDDFKNQYLADSAQLQAAYLSAGKAEMAEKAPSWRVQEVE